MNYLGIDLGGTNIVAGVVNEDNQILAKASCKTNIPRPEEAICDDMAMVAREALKKAGLTMDDVPWVGIGCPGSVNQGTGIIEYSNNLGFHNWPLEKMMTDRMKKKIILENDANAAAYGEYVAGAAKDAKDAVAVTLGTGVGTGIIIDGKIYSGCNYAGAEMGHMVIVKDGRPCTCGREGCWEAYASATGLIALTKEAMLESQADPDSVMWKMVGGDIDKVSGRTAFDAMRQGDSLGKAVVDRYISYLGCGLVNAINIFQPDVICLGGGISKEGENLLRPLRAYVERERYSKHAKKQTQLCTAQLGNDAGIIGAAFLGRAIGL
ncbi:MAG: ROK family protein [Clostridiales bacterium]|jgi:glucokinase|nr:ROK family protein [Clostridiales bacterium]